MADDIKTALQKVAALVKTIYETSGYKTHVELLTYSIISFEDAWNPGIIGSGKEISVTLHVHPDVYVKMYSMIPSIAKSIRHDFNRVSDFTFDEVEILPDYDKFALVDATIQSIYTDWEEINHSQQKLLSQLRQSTDHLDFQNIGNTARTILQHLAETVFDPAQHIHSDPTADMSAAKFKNRLHAYIETELKGQDNETLRKFAKAQITAMEKTIDLANTTTHKLGVEWPFAEACAIGTINVISVVKVIHKSKQKP